MRAPVVLFFHQLVAEPRPGHYFFRHSPTFDDFRDFIIQLRAHYNPLGIDEFHHGWQNDRKWPRRSVVVTFDDGFKNNLRAARILHEHDIQGAFFVLSDVVDSQFMPWYIRFSHILSSRAKHGCNVAELPVNLLNSIQRRRWMYAFKERLLSVSASERNGLLHELSDQLAAEPIDPHSPDYAYFSSDDLRELHSMGMAVGSHSATHTNLARCNEKDLHYELVESREVLSAHIGDSVAYVSYPDGRFNRSVLDLASKHYRLGFAASDHYAPNHAMRFPRRNARADLSILSRAYPLKKFCLTQVKKCLGMG